MRNRYRRLLAVIVLLWATGSVTGRALALTFTEFQLPKGSGPIDITTGSDGALWFTDGTGLRVGRITTDGVITEFPIPIPLGVSGSLPYHITAGPGAPPLRHPPDTADLNLITHAVGAVDHTPAAPPPSHTPDTASAPHVLSTLPLCLLPP